MQSTASSAQTARVARHRSASSKASALAPRKNVTVRAASFAPPTVMETKNRFVHAYSKPVAPIYNVVLQELLVQHHFIRHNSNYAYNQVYALGVVSAFDHILDSLPEAERTAVFAAYISALGEDSLQYRTDAADLERLAAEVASPSGMTAAADGPSLQQSLALVAEQNAAGTIGYNKFFAIGLFRLLELSGVKDPLALEQLVSNIGLKMDVVNKDLNLYKGILSKLQSAKELMQEFLEREKRKQAEREAEKAAKAAKESVVVVA